MVKHAVCKFSELCDGAHVTSCKTYKLAEPPSKCLSNTAPVSNVWQTCRLPRRFTTTGQFEKGVRMNTRNIQTFLMVSAAFFAMSAPVRSSTGGAGAPANAISRSALVAPARVAIARVARENASDEQDQNS
jgi:hypothetical protein